ncbi:MAG: hypothetical protein ISS57_19360 [Anaerolineales bacterium]|nr:hypothetical protein [Anaerolineales bacterium]
MMNTQFLSPRRQKKSHHKSVGLLLILLTFGALLIGCNLPGITQAQQPAVDVDVVGTAIQQTLIAQGVIAELTKAASQDQQPQDQAQQPEEPIPPTATDTPVYTVTPSLTLPPTNTPTPGVPMVSVSVDTNCRIGTGKVFELLGALLVGEETEIIARDPSGLYWYVKNPDRGGFCWLWGNYATTKGDTGSLPVFTPLPTPTQTPTPTPVINFNVSFHEVDGCVGWNIEFEITNNGELMFQSVSTSVTDNDTAQTVTSQYDKFEEWNGCLAGSTYQDLDPGDTGYTTSGTLMNDPTGHDLDASVQLCTQNGLGGTCLTKNLSFTP